MGFIEPDREPLFASEEYSSLSHTTIDWIAVLANIYDERGPNPDATPPPERVAEVRRLLALLNQFATTHRLSESAVRAVVLVSTWLLPWDDAADAVRAEAERFDWNTLQGETGVDKVVQRLFTRGELNAPVAAGPAAAIVGSAVRGLPQRDRAAVYARRGYPDKLVAEIEGFEPTTPDASNLAPLAIIDPELPGRVLSGTSNLMLTAEREHLVPVEALALARWNPNGLSRCVRRLVLADQLTLLGLMLGVREDEHGNWSGEVVRAAQVPHEDTSAQLTTALIELGRETDPTLTIVPTIIDRLGHEGPASVNLLFEELFPGAGVTRLDLFHIRPETLGEVYDDLLDALSDWLQDADRLAAAAEWTRSKQRDGEQPGPRSELSFHLLRNLLEAVVAKGEESFLPLFWLTFSDGGHPKTEGIAGDDTITHLVEWAGSAPSAMRAVLSLGMAEWSDPNDHSYWIDFVVSHWLTGNAAEDNPDDTESVTLLRSILTDRTMRERMRVFAESLDLLTAVPRDQSAPAPAATLIAAAVGEATDVVAALAADPNPATRAFAAVVGHQLAEPEELFALYRESGLVHELDAGTWEPLGLPQVDVDRTCLSEEIGSCWPDVGMAVLRWSPTSRGAHTNDSDPTRLVRLLQSPDLLAESEEADEIARVCLCAEILRTGPDRLIGTEDLAQYADAAIGSLRNLRLALREGAPEKSLWVWATPECALVAGATLGWWKALKPLLLAARASTDPGVDPALRAVRDTVTGRIARAIEVVLRREKPEEEQRQLRRDLALDLIEKLKPHKGDPSVRSIPAPAHDEPGFDASITEPDPVWRAGYLHALRDLGVKQTGKGHFVTGVIRRVADGDPSPPVREAGGRTADYLDRLRDGWEKGSNKRLLFHAWWWIRQAWRMSLRADIDATEANRTRNTEFR